MKTQECSLSGAFVFLLCLVWGSQAYADRCTDLAAIPYGGATVTSAVTIGETGTHPSYCKVNASTGIQTEIEVWLPEIWHRRLLHVGGGGFDGTISLHQSLIDTDMLLEKGFALTGSNGGHDASTHPDATFGSNPTLTQDYAYVAIGATLRVAKALVTAYYGERPGYSYFWGCSNGGRGALNAAAKYRDEYDGVIAAAPSRNLPGATVGWLRNIPAKLLTPAKIAMIHNATLAECDQLDGLRDGVIGNPDACRFNPVMLKCPPDTDNYSCLTDAEIAVVNTARSDTTLSNGDTVYLKNGFGALDAAWAYSVLVQGFVGFVYQDPDYDPARFDPDRDYPAIVEVLEGAYDMSADTEALVRYLESDRKLIVWHGTDDTILSHYDTIRSFYEVVKAANDSGRRNAKLYLAAGVGHCCGGPGADTFDMIGPMTEWVEHHKEPGAVLAYKIDPSSGAVLFTRPLCEYPGFPQYKGQGDPGNATSFYCKRPLVSDAYGSH